MTRPILGALINFYKISFLIRAVDREKQGGGKRGKNNDGNRCLKMSCKFLAELAVPISPYKIYDKISASTATTATNFFQVLLSRLFLFHLINLPCTI